MSVNAPSEFRNVYPVIIHDIVRRTAEVTQLANKEAEERRVEEEKTKKMKLNLEMQKAKPDKESLYYFCIKAKLNAGLSDNEKIVAECKTLVNSKPE
jgi:predicted transcriptional regulator YheO